MTPLVFCMSCGNPSAHDLCIVCELAERSKTAWPPTAPAVADERNTPDVVADAVPGNSHAVAPVTRKRAVNDPADGHAHLRTDLANARLFAELHGSVFRHVRENRTWLNYTDGRWLRDVTGAADRAAKETVDVMFQHAVDLAGDARAGAVRHALSSQSAGAQNAMLQLASTEPGIAIRADALDRDPYLLSCANGTLDLRTGLLRPHDPDDLLSLGNSIEFDADAKCTRWLRFLDEVFPGDADLIAFVQRCIGYSLTGDTREHVVIILHGSGRNGKTTLVETVKQLVGTLAKVAPFDSFARARGDRGTRNDLARLHRARFVSSVESAEGRKLDESLVKQLSGGDSIAVRYLYSEHFEYRPEFTIWLATNSKPQIDAGDDAVWARMRLIPFGQCFLGREDRALAGDLHAELPGILSWAVQGCLDWQRDGLGQTAAVDIATSDYRAGEDPLADFLADRCTITAGARVEARILRAAYEAWCTGNGVRPLAANELGKALNRHAVTPERTKHARYYVGIQVSE